MKNVKELIGIYETKKKKIEDRLGEFKETLNQSDERVFAELAFCLCTPQSKAVDAWNAVSSLMGNDLLYNGNKKEIRPFLNSVRFADNKAKYIVEAREFFTENEKIKIKDEINSFDSSFKLRDFLVKDIKGIGMKEAGHFIRNIGFDYNNQLAILDRHVLKNLKDFGIIERLPKTLTRKIYLEIEGKMKTFSENIKISMYELDMLFWSKETGKIFK